MKAMILAAGLGTRLRPWTLSHPKALVPVNGVPMLERVIVRLKENGFDYIIINVHHFSSQIIDFVKNREFGVSIGISDESERLLDTGGGLVKASSLIGNEPLLIHNVDILSNGDLRGLMNNHMSSGEGASLLVSDRVSSRRLIFDEKMMLRGWHKIAGDEYKPEGFKSGPHDQEYAFSGIYVASPCMLEEMRELYGDKPFPVMDYLLSPSRRVTVKGVIDDELKLIDIGKPETLNEAGSWLQSIN